MNENLIRHQTVVLISKILHPLTESNLIPFPEYREIIAQLKHIAAKGDAHRLKEKIRAELKEHGISHATLEMEEENEPCHEAHCHIEAVSVPRHHHH